MAQTNPKTMQLKNIIPDMENGDIKIPQFQRDFVWSKESSAKLMDSIIKGYPVGAFTFWKTKERLRNVKSIGGITFPESSDTDYINYVLDGQQRITSIYASVTGAKIGNQDYSEMYINLVATEDEQIVILDPKDLANDEYIPVKDVYALDLDLIVKKYINHTPKIQKYHDVLTSYSFSGIEIKDSSLDIATEIFTRINTTGKSLSLFEIMCAKTYDEAQKFDLYEKRNEQVEKWETVNYDTIPSQTVLQAIAMCINKTTMNKSCKRKDILKLDKQQFIKGWEDVDKAFDEAIDYFKSFFNIPVSKLLPYDALLVPFVYYFYINKKKPEGKSATYLKDYFWRAVFSKRFTEGVEGKLAMDCTNIVDPIIAGEKPLSKHLPIIDISIDSIKRNGVFSLSSAYVKGMVCILAAQHPQSFIDGAEVTIDNAWLSQSNSKNYHHYFPKAYMKKNHKSIETDMVNHIVNITIVDGYLNKVKIKDKAPSVYMKEFATKNKKIDKTMATHLISDLSEYGIWDDDYETFFAKRIVAIQDEIKERLIEIPDDRGFSEQQNENTDLDIDITSKTTIDVFDESSYKDLKVGVLARNFITYLLENNLLSDEEIVALKGEEYSRKRFKGNTYPVLANSKFDNMYNSKKVRYYAEPVETMGTKVYISSQWLEPSKDDIISWFKEHIEK